MLVGACDSKTVDERCEEMADYIEGRESLLERDCRVDTDCRVVFVRPDRPLAANSEPGDAELVRVLATYQEDCQPIPTAISRLTSVCVTRVIDVPHPENVGETVLEEIGQVCVLRGDYELPELDAGLDAADVGVDADEDTAPCACTDSSGCDAGETCWRCSCVARTLCGDACMNADGCEMLDIMGLGADAATCAANCETALDLEPDSYPSFATCLRERACDDMLACRNFVP